MDNEVSGTGNQYDYGFRVYNPRLAKFLSVDPLTKDYPWYTPYQFAGNKPIWAIDLDGLEEYRAPDGTIIGSIDGSTEVRVVTDQDISNFEALIKLANENDGTAKEFFTLMANEFSTSLIDYAENTDDVLEDFDVVPYIQNCNTAARKQMKDAGFMVEGPGTAFHTSVDNSKQTPYQKHDESGELITTIRYELTEDPIGGVIYLMTQLKNGNPVMLGLDTYDADRGNYNALSNHYVVASKMNKNGNEIGFEYVDNNGQSRGNLLNLNTQTGVITQDDTSGTVSEVRKAKKLD